MKKAKVAAAAATTGMTFDFSSSTIGKDRIRTWVFCQGFRLGTWLRISVGALGR
jgi:hypothetical protein